MNGSSMPTRILRALLAVVALGPIAAACAAPAGDAGPAVVAAELEAAVATRTPVASWRWQAAHAGCDDVLPSPLAPTSGFHLRPADGAPGLFAVVGPDGLVACVDTADALLGASFVIVELLDGDLALTTNGWEDLLDGLDVTTIAPKTTVEGAGTDPAPPEDADDEDGSDDEGEDDGGDEDEDDEDDEDEDEDEDEDHLVLSTVEESEDDERPELRVLEPEPIEEPEAGPWHPHGGDPNPQPMSYR